MSDRSFQPFTVYIDYSHAGIWHLFRWDRRDEGFVATSGSVAALVEYAHEYKEKSSDVRHLRLSPAAQVVRQIEEIESRKGK